MTRRPTLPPVVAVRVVLDDVPTAVAGLSERIAAAGGLLRTLSTVGRLEPRGDEPSRTELEIEVEGLDEEALIRAIHGTPGLRAKRLTKTKLTCQKR